MDHAHLNGVINCLSVSISCHPLLTFNHGEKVRNGCEAYCNVCLCAAGVLFSGLC